jgi:hypothetical protein
MSITTNDLLYYVNGLNPNYQVLINIAGKGSIKSWLSTSFSFDLSNTSTARMGLDKLSMINNILSSVGVLADSGQVQDLMQSMGLGKYIKDLKNLGATSIYSRELSQLHWRGSERFKFSLSCVFLAYTEGDNPLNYVRMLSGTVLPKSESGKSGIYERPIGFGEGEIFVEIGKTLRIPNLSISSVGYEISKETTTDGVPVYVTADISFESLVSITQKEFESFVLKR